MSKESEPVLYSFEQIVAMGFAKNRFTLKRRIDKGQFPAPIHLSAHSVAWLRREVDEWLAEKVAERNLISREQT